MELIVVGIIVWLLSPIFLGIYTIVLRKRERRQKEILYHLHTQGRITDADLTAAGLKLPVQQIPSEQPQHAGEPVQTLLPPGIPEQPVLNPETAMQAASDRAKAIAEAELNGEPIPPAVPETETVTAEPLTAEPSAAVTDAAADVVTETAAESAPETAAEPSGETVPQVVPVPAAEKPAAVQPSAPAPVFRTERGGGLSAISIMLSVGVALVILAGLIFVRSAWASMGAVGKLATLAAGSGLFFGASALAKRAWDLERTGMAFFTLGAVFLPISVWAAGYLNLLGEGLAGATNPWLISVAFVSFTVIALIAVRSFRQLGWGIAAAAGAALAYYFAAGGLEREVSLADGSRKAVGLALFVLAAALPAPLLTFRAEQLHNRLKEPLSRVIQPFAVCFASVSALLTLRCFGAGNAGHKLTALYAAAFILIAAALLAPVFTKRIGNYTMLPFTAFILLSSAMLLYPLYDRVLRQYDAESGQLLRSNGDVYAAVFCMAAVIAILLLLLLRVLPENTQKGGLWAAFGVTALSAFPHLSAVCDMKPGISAAAVILIAVTVLTLLVWLCAAGKNPMQPVSILIACLSAFLVPDMVRMLYTGGNFYTMLFIAAGMLVLLGVFVVTKKHRTGISDLLFTVLSGCFAVAAAAPRTPDVMNWAVSGLLLLLTLICWTLTLEHDTQRPIQYLFAVLCPVGVYCAVFLMPEIPFSCRLVLLTVLFAAIGFTTYLTTKKRFRYTRQTLFGVTLVPALLVAAGSPLALRSGWYLLNLAIGAAVAFGVWRIFANRGFKILSALSFGATLFLTAELTYIAVRDKMFHGELRFTELMVAAVWIILMCALSAAISKRMVLFVGSDAVVHVMDFAAPVSAMVLAAALLALSRKEWEPFCFVFTLAVCVLAWIVTKPTHLVTPAICAGALLVTLEALRVHAHKTTDVHVAVMLIAMLGLSVLFPYLGMVQRESEDDPARQKKSWILTALGGVIPLWLLAVMAGLNAFRYSRIQLRWMMFFVPVMAAGFLLQLSRGYTESAPNKARTLRTAAAACMTAAFWLQPMFDVKDTYFAGKLHILPLVGFGIVIRKLYGKETGGGFLFAIGCYSMLRLGIGAAVSENGADLLTVLAVGLILFVASFYVRQKKWFLLGGISLLLTGAYMHMKLTDGRQWWVYLLLIGLLLIAVAAANETLKKRGDSLKTRAGRLWDDWEW